MAINIAMYIYLIQAKHDARNFQFETFVLAESEEHAVQLAKERFEQCVFEFFKIDKFPPGVDIWHGCGITVKLDNAPRVLKFGWDRLGERGPIRAQRGPFALADDVAHFEDGGGGNGHVRF